MVQILNRRQKNNPCLIGEPGVGKTAIAEGLAQRIAAGEVPFKLRDKEVYLLDLTALVAGTQFRGQFESRMKGLIEEIRKLGNVILVIDEVHNIVGAGDAEGSMNAANILKPALSRGEIQVIGATTFNEYRKYIEKDTALERRFQPVTVAEPSIEDTLKILKGIAHYYETYHGVSIPEGVLRQAVLLSERYITDRFLPDKAIDLHRRGLLGSEPEGSYHQPPDGGEAGSGERDLRAGDPHVCRGPGGGGGDGGAAGSALCPHRRAAEPGDAPAGGAGGAGEEGCAAGDHGEHRTGHRDVDQDSRQQDQGRRVQASGGAGCAAEDSTS